MESVASPAPKELCTSSLASLQGDCNILTDYAPLEVEVFIFYSLFSEIWTEGLW